MNYTFSISSLSGYSLGTTNAAPILADKIEGIAHPQPSSYTFLPSTLIFYVFISSYKYFDEFHKTWLHKLCSGANLNFKPSNYKNFGSGVDDDSSTNYIQWNEMFNSWKDDNSTLKLSTKLYFLNTTTLIM